MPTAYRHFGANVDPVQCYISHENMWKDLAINGPGDILLGKKRNSTSDYAQISVATLIPNDFIITFDILRADK